MAYANKLNLLDCKIDLVYEDAEHWSQGSLGRCNMKRSSIHLSSQMADDMSNMTLLHELIHMIADMNSIDLSEQSVDGLAIGMMSFLKGNPEMVKNITKGDRAG